MCGTDGFLCYGEILQWEGGSNQVGLTCGRSLPSIPQRQPEPGTKSQKKTLVACPEVTSMQGHAGGSRVCDEGMAVYRGVPSHPKVTQQ